MSEDSREGEGRVYIDRGEPLPQSYGENRLVALVRDPEHLFAYWDVATEFRVAGTPVILRVHCLTEGRYYDLEPGRQADNWYLRVTPNQAYRLELYARPGSGELQILASSREVATPPRWAGESGEETPVELIHAQHWPLTRGEGIARTPIETVPSAGEPEHAPTPVPASVPHVSGSGHNRGDAS